MPRKHQLLQRYAAARHDGRLAAAAWCLRIVRHQPSTLEQVSGADEPYLALRRESSASARGSTRLELRPALEGDAYADEERTRPDTLHAARRCSPAASRARAFGHVVDRFLDHADVELRTFGAAVADWEPGFERL